MNNLITEHPLFVKLKFSQEWLDLELLSADDFKIIEEDYSISEDNSSEHYRWKIFKIYLKKIHITEDSFFGIYALSLHEPDYFMGRAMRFDLIKRMDCPLDLIEKATHEDDLTLKKHAMKYKNIRINDEKTR